MTKRQPHKQSRHDAKVRSLARQLEREGWDVQADLPGEDRPDPIGQRSHIPDIVARKRGAERIIEIETDDTLQRDKRQHEAFRRRAGLRPLAASCPSGP